MPLKRKVCDAIRPVLNVSAIADELCTDREDEPSEGDYVWDDAKQTVYEVEGRYLGRFEDQDAAEEFIVKRMARQKFWPNVWWLSDHGNFHPLVLRKGD